MTSNPTWWLVRCEGGALYEDFVEQGIVALGGEEPQPDLSAAATREQLYDILQQSGIWSNVHSLGYALGVLSKFVFDMSPGQPGAMTRRSRRSHAPFAHDCAAGRESWHPVPDEPLA